MSLSWRALSSHAVLLQPQDGVRALPTDPQRGVAGLAAVAAASSVNAHCFPRDTTPSQHLYL